MFSVFKIATSLAFAGQVSAMLEFFGPMDGFPSGSVEGSWSDEDRENRGDKTNEAGEHEASKMGPVGAGLPPRPAGTMHPRNDRTTMPPVLTRTDASSTVVSDQALAGQDSAGHDDDLMFLMDGVDDQHKTDEEHKEDEDKSPTESTSRASDAASSYSSPLSSGLLFLRASGSVSKAFSQEAHIAQTERSGTS